MVCERNSPLWKNDIYHLWCSFEIGFLRVLEMHTYRSFGMTTVKATFMRITSLRPIGLNELSRASVL